jgi:hypothetical protein
VTAEYASKQLGDTTIFSKTFQDFAGTKRDNTRYAEQKRALMHASEIRQIGAHSEVLIVSDTAPPIRAAYPPLAVAPHLFPAEQKGTPRDIHLGDVDKAYLLTGPAGAADTPKAIQRGLVSLVSEEVDRMFTDERISEMIKGSNTGRIGQPAAKAESNEKTKSERHRDALDDLPADLRFNLAAQYERAQAPT